MLRRGLLEGLTIAFAGDAEQAIAGCAALGARTPRLAVDLHDERAVDAALAELVLPDAVVCATGDLDAAFIVTRTVAAAWIAARRGGKVMLVAPVADEPLRAALENLARTLSVEWARYGIRPTAILPGDGTTAEQVAALVAFLGSGAGDYYSGCAFSLGAARAG